MADKSYTTYQQHEPLRTPAGWGTQEKRFIAQLEEIFDDIYRRFNRIRLKDLSEETAEAVEAGVEAGEAIEDFTTNVLPHIQTAIEEYEEGIKFTVTDGVITSIYNQTTTGITLNAQSIGLGSFTISGDKLYNGVTSMSDTAHNGIYIGTNGIRLGKGVFSVSNTGALTCTDATITGTLKGGSWTFNSNGARFDYSSSAYGRMYASGSTMYYRTNGMNAVYGADYSHTATIYGSWILLSATSNGQAIRIGKGDGSGGSLNDACIVDDDSDTYDTHGNLGTWSKPWDYLYSYYVEYYSRQSWSSRDVKHDIEDMPEVGSILDRLRPVSFEYNMRKPSDKNYERYGLIYEEVVDVLPTICIDPDPEKSPYGGINYDDLVPLLLKEIQSLRRRVAALES